MLVNNLALISK